MRRSIRVMIRVALLALSAFCAASAMAQDPAKVASDIYKVRLDSPRVRVLEVTGKAGQKAPMHHHPGYVVYNLADGSVRFTDAKGATSDAPMKAGETTWRDAENHASEVLSDIHVLLFELKGAKKATPARGAKADDPVSVDPGHFKVLLDNERVRVLDYHAEAGYKTPMHSHPGYVTYDFDGGKTTFSYPKGKPVERVTKAGDLVWHNPETHAGQVSASAGVHILLVEIK
jgi:quercetin dioxygenase-like cupin family protein